MKVVFAGGGGGHFYPIIAIAQELGALLEERRIANVQMYFIADKPYDERALFEHRLIFKRLSTGKMRTYTSAASSENIIDMFKTGIACVHAICMLFALYPDVVIGKGGYASFPTLFAARLLRIPVIIHESDAVPGRVNRWAGKFAKRIAVSYPEAAQYFPQGKTAFTGAPIRHEIQAPIREGSHEFFGLDPALPTLFVLGGSQGAQVINDGIVEALPQLVERYQLIHQTGPLNLTEVEQTSALTLENNPNAHRYKPLAYLNDEAMVRAAGIADLVISRAGSTVFELASWGLPSIMIPLAIAHGDHQRKNAYIYAKAGACEVIDEANLTPHILAAEINAVMDDPERRKRMASAAKAFAKDNAAAKITQQIVAVLVDHRRMEAQPQE